MTFSRSALWTGRGAAAGLIAVVLLAGCGRNERQACSDGQVTSRVIDRARMESPNKATAQLTKRGAYPYFQKVLKEHGWDESNTDQAREAMLISTNELQRVYTSGKYSLDNFTLTDSDSEKHSIRCNARLTVLSEWGIATVYIGYEATHLDSTPEITLFGLQ